MPIADIVRLWHGRQSLGLMPLRKQKNLFFHRGRVFVLNRRNRKYRRYQAQKALSRRFRPELTFLDAIDKDVILSDIEI